LRAISARRIPGLGGRQAARGAFDQACAGPFLQGRQRARDGGRGTAQAPRGAAQARRLQDRNENLQFIEAVHRYISDF
jgi:hypothetical protein